MVKKYNFDNTYLAQQQKSNVENSSEFWLQGL